MNSMSQVAQLIEDLKSKGAVLSDAAWETALACVGWPYVFGAWGEECTPTNRKRRAREDHPTVVSKCQVLSGRSGVCAGCQWDLPVRMFDCRGFTDWVLKQFGIDLTGEGATSQWNTASNWMAQGSIDTIPDDVLVCLFVHNSKTGKKEHTGFGYRGQTVECSSGVQHFKTRNKKWTHWAMPRGISDTIPEPTPVDPGHRPTLRNGSKGEYVTLMQTKLIQLGYDLEPYGADGSYGNKTAEAVRAFQRDSGLTADGVCGPRTWAALESGEISLYTVRIEHLSKTVADEIIGKYGGIMTKE